MNVKLQIYTEERRISGVIAVKKFNMKLQVKDWPYPNSYIPGDNLPSLQFAGSFCSLFSLAMGAIKYGPRKMAPHPTPTPLLEFRG